MPLIKARQAQDKVAQAEVLRLQDVEVEARRILDDARRRADKLIADAQTRAHLLKADARKAGLEAGQVEGLARGLEQGRRQAFEQARSEFATRHAATAQALAAALEQFEVRRCGLLSELERDVVALAGAIAARVVKRAVEVDPSCVTQNLREALQLLGRRSRLQIRLHPDDLEQSRQLAQDLAAAQNLSSVEFVADDTLDRGGVMLVTDGGCVDATVETQWTRILDEILSGWQEHWLLSRALRVGSPPTSAAEAVSDEDGAAFVEIVPTAPASFPAGPDEAEPTRPQAEPLPPSAAAAAQALIDDALAQAMRAMEQGSSPEAADEPLVEEIDPREVEDAGSGTGCVQETDPA